MFLLLVFGCWLQLCLHWFTKINSRCQGTQIHFLWPNTFKHQLSAVHCWYVRANFLYIGNWPSLRKAPAGASKHQRKLLWHSVRSCSHTIPEKVRNSRPINMGFKGWGWLLWWSWVTFKPFRYKKFNRRAQTVNFSVLSRRRQELCAENP